MSVNLVIPSLGSKFQDYRDAILGDSYNWGPVIDASKVKYFAFHHSVTSQTAKIDGNWKAECDKIAQEHVNGNGWGGIGYRFVICSDGTVAYVGDLSHGGSAVTGNNDIIFSACLVGDFTKELPTAAQIHSAFLLQQFFRTQLPQYPLISNASSIIGHQDAYASLHLPGATPTACPGPNWEVGSDTLRDRILNDRYAGYPNPQPTVSVPTPPPVVTPPPSVPVPPMVIVDPLTMIALGSPYGTMELRKIKEVLNGLKLAKDTAESSLAVANGKLNQIKQIVS